MADRSDKCLAIRSSRMLVRIERGVLWVHALKLSKGDQIKIRIKIADISAQKTAEIWQLNIWILRAYRNVCFPSRMIDDICTVFGEV